MLLSIIEKINFLNECIFASVDSIIEKLPLEEWVSDAIIDSIHLLPFLFIIFVLIEIIEFYFSEKINSLVKNSSKFSIIIASLASIFPQCGFSVMASSLYTRKIITRGCLIAVYLGTSDECLPILLAHPEKIHLVIPVIAVKFAVAIMAGYFLDFVWKNIKSSKGNVSTEEVEIGCCHHSPQTHNKRELILHPVCHTVNIFAFILVITLILNYLLEHLSLADILFKQLNSLVLCVVSSLIGLIPNCAVSIAITMMLIKGHITFGVAMSGLLSNSGLALIILLKNNDFKDNLKIISILLLISVISGVALELILP